MSIREITNKKDRIPVAYGLVLKFDSDGCARAYVIPVYPGEAEALRRDETSLLIFYDDKADAEQEAEEINAIAEESKMMKEKYLKRWEEEQEKGDKDYGE